MKTPSWIDGLKPESKMEVPKGYYSAREISEMTGRTVKRCREILAEKVKANQIKCVKVKHGRAIENYYGQ